MAIMDFNYDKAMSQANQITDIANEMLAVARNQYQSTIESISVCWKGEASQQFVGHCTSTQSEIKDEANKLLDLASRIRRVARILEDAEARAKKLAEERSQALNQLTKK